MSDIVKYKVKTLSNLFIGGAPLPFEIGGIDQQTTLDQEGYPYIPASSEKGSVRSIVHEDNSDEKTAITKLYTEYLKSEEIKNRDKIKTLVKEDEALARVRERYKEAQNAVSAEYLFGISGFNNTPKLMFSDLRLCEKFRDEKSCFSIDMKNSITANGTTLTSNPRTYKAARSGLTFTGEIRLHKIDALGKGAEQLCKDYIIYILKKFNEGIYRLGNSKSRGYGKIGVSIETEEQ
ncbi:RAMP superfamily CRISPR-associated protein [Pectinatus frisingensis]|uniref:RAMP superfamily CRISPR-associated protein n=1 Tax=Pectinatus frisingensis TaxID=865 RepID=UPI0015F57F52|nr:RAMP superfamily CRISPR-associated protein [Pectinatus frisingensis]